MTMPVSQTFWARSFASIGHSEVKELGLDAKLAPVVVRLSLMIDYTIVVDRESQTMRV